MEKCFIDHTWQSLGEALLSDLTSKRSRVLNHIEQFHVHNHVHNQVSITDMYSQYLIINPYQKVSKEYYRQLYQEIRGDYSHEKMGSLDSMVVQHMKKFPVDIQVPMAHRHADFIQQYPNFKKLSKKTYEKVYRKTAEKENSKNEQNLKVKRNHESDDKISPAAGKKSKIVLQNHENRNLFASKCTVTPVENAGLGDQDIVYMDQNFDEVASYEEVAPEASVPAAIYEQEVQNSNDCIKVPDGFSYELF